MTGGPLQSPAVPESATAVDVKELFLQASPAKPHLDCLVWMPADDELHFYAKGVTAREFAAVFEPEIAKAPCLVTTFDPAILAPEFWEPLTRDAEESLRGTLGGVITRGGELWRADRAGGKLLAGNGEATLVHGRVLRASGAFVAELAKSDAALEFAVFKELPVEAELGRLASRLAGEVETFRPVTAKPEILFSHDGSGAVRAVFRSRDHLRRAINALLRGYLHRLTGQHIGFLPVRAADRFAAAVDGLGCASSSSDFLDKRRTFEFQAWLGRSAWPVRTPDALEDLGEDPRLLVYYDRVGGMWEVAS